MNMVWIKWPYQLLWVATSNEGSCLNGGSAHKYDRVLLTRHLISERESSHYIIITSSVTHIHRVGCDVLQVVKQSTVGPFPMPLP